MKIFIKNVLIVLFCAILSTSCQKILSDNNSASRNGEQSYDRYNGKITLNIYEALETYSSRTWDRVVRIGSNKAIGANHVNRYSVECFIGNSANNSAAYGDLIIEGEIIPYLTEKNRYDKSFPYNYQPIKGCFGDTTAIQMKNASNAAILDDHFYVPMDLNVTVTGDKDGSSLSRNAVFTWNPDPKNDKGVAINILFSANSGINDEFSNHQSLGTTILTEDDGEFQLSETNFTGMPIGAFISVDIARGNYKTMLDTEGRHYFVYAYSKCNNYFYLK